MAYQICKRCVMDNAADPYIRFDEQGYCNYCTEALEHAPKVYFPNEEGQRRLEKMLRTVKEAGKGKEYDCIMGLSGGLDSSYLAYLGYKWDLRILAVHTDDGYDTEISKENIRKLCAAATIKLIVAEPDRVQYDGLIRAHMEAGVPNIAAPQDSIALAYVYKAAREAGIKYLLSGVNFAMESLGQHSDSGSYMDLVNIKDINRRFGTEKTDRLKFMTSYWKYAMQKTGRLVTLYPLDYVDYNRDRAFAELKEFCGFEYYGRKHLENILTAFIQLRWYPEKFGIDKRKWHLSSMIASGQMTRDEALHELQEPMFDEDIMTEYVALIKKRMALSDEELERIMKAPVHDHSEYRTDKIDPLIRKVFFSK